jgi:Bacterial archaeo-eukaryotic release factor family 2
MRLDFLRPVYEAAGPFASVYVDTSRATEDAAHAVALRWRGAGEELTAAGCDQRTVDALGEVVTDPDRAAPGRAAFAASGQVVYTEALPRPPVRPMTVWAPLPYILPLLAERDEPVPHVRVLVDREGADITALGAHRHDDTTVRGQTWPIQKVREGGWSEARYQRSAVETWKHNAKQVARAVEEEAAACGAEMIIIGGDERACEMLIDHLSTAVRDRAVVAAHGGRSPGASDRTWDAEVNSLLHEKLDARRRSQIEAFREGHGKGDAVAGLGNVAVALRAGQVDTLLFDGAPEGELWCGPEPLQLAASQRELNDLGASEAVRAPAADAVIRAAVTTAAAADFSEPGELSLTDSIGALLRFAA